jgi:uncharacterized repeat protein (TIGR01451 family)
VKTGEYIKYTISTQNIGTAWAYSSVFKDPLPAGTSYVANSAELNGSNMGLSTYPSVGFSINSPSAASGVIKFAPDADTVTISFVVKVNATSGTVQNQATVSFVDGSGLASETPDCSSTPKLNCSVTGSLPVVAVPTVTLSGTVWNDLNTNATFDTSESGTNTGATPVLNVVLTNSSGVVIAVVPVAADGTYSIPGVTKNTDVKLVLTTENPSVGSSVSTNPNNPLLPEGWVSATPNTLAFNTGSSNVTGKNFGLQDPQWDVRFFLRNVDCSNDKVEIEVQVRSHTGHAQLLMGDANYRFQYPANVLQNPSIIEQTNFSSVAPSSDLDYGVQNLNGSVANATNGIVSLNTFYSGSGTGAKLVDYTWMTVSTIRFNVVARNAIGQLIWNDNLTFPVTGMNAVELVDTAVGAYNYYLPAAGGVFGNLSVDPLDTTCAPKVVTVTGTVWNDSNGGITIDGTPPEAGTNASSLTVYVVDGSGNVVDKATVASDGTYTLSDVPQNSSITLRLSTDSSVAVGGTAPTASSLPSGWVNTGENLNGTSETSTPGEIALTTGTTNFSNMNFGIEQTPTATGSSSTAQPNPGGTTPTSVPTGVFSGSDPDGTVTKYTITNFPSNADSVTINGTPYTSSTFPSGGVDVTADPGGAFPSGAISVDPIDGAVTVGIKFTVTDNAGKTSPASSTANVPFQIPSITGTVWIDADARQTLNGEEIGSNLASSTLTVYLVDSSNQVIAKTLVPSDGQFVFYGIASGTYTLILSNDSSVNVGSLAPAAGLPVNWAHTAETTGDPTSGPADGTGDGRITVVVP